jgi:hypothetical protein
MSVSIGLRIGFLALAIALLAPAAAAWGEPLCDKRDAVLKLLSDDFSEVPTAIGLVASGGVMELLISERGSWSLILTLPTGLSCLVATGDSWATKPTVNAGSPI